MSNRCLGSSEWDWYAWRLPLGDASEQQDAQARMTVLCTREVVPKKLTEEQNSMIATLCANPGISMPSSLAKYLIQQTLGIKVDPKRRIGRRLETIDDVANGKWAQALLGDAIAGGYQVTDMRYFNGAKADQSFEPFETCLTTMLESNIQLAPDERRAADGADGTQMVVRPTALAPSLPQLRERVMDMMKQDANLAAKLESGEAKVPSLSALAARMCPIQSRHATSLRMLSRLPIKWAVQHRTARKVNPDSHYNNMQSVLLREDLLHDAMRMDLADVLFISDDDKCKIKVGNPGFAQTAVTRNQRILTGKTVTLLGFAVA